MEAIFHGDCVLFFEFLLILAIELLLLPIELRGHGCDWWFRFGFVGLACCCCFFILFVLDCTHSEVVLQKGRFLLITDGCARYSFLIDRLILFRFAFLYSSTFPFTLLDISLWISLDMNLDLLFLLSTEGNGCVWLSRIEAALFVCEFDDVGFLVEGSDRGVGEVLPGAFLEEGFGLFLYLFGHLNYFIITAANL